MENSNKTLSFIERMRQNAQKQKDSVGECYASEAQVASKTCPSCGASRGVRDGLTKCAYCGFEFMSVELTDGINVTKENNSK